MTTPITGGCQCGAVRYRINGALRGPGICHCRMCQKAFGGAFAALASVSLADLEWTRGHPRLFDSSDEVARGFCANCGTPLTFAYKGRDYLDISLGSLDEPAKVAPEGQVWASSQIRWFGHLHELPARAFDDPGYEETVAAIAASNHQHPDHDTPDDGPDAWTPRPARDWITT
jgi:hypothetical protein